MSTDTDLSSSPVIQFSVMLPNESGALQSLLKLLKSSGVEVLGISAKDSSDVTITRIIVSDPETTAQVFIERGIAHITSEMLVVAFREPATELLACLEAFTNAETNIDFGYALLPNPEGKSLLAFHVDDVDFGKHILFNAGFVVMEQDDLSR